MARNTTSGPRKPSRSSRRGQVTGHDTDEMEVGNVSDTGEDVSEDEDAEGLLDEGVLDSEGDFESGGYDEETSPLASEKRIRNLPIKDLYIYIHEGQEDREAGLDIEPVSYNPKHQTDGSTDCLMIESHEYDADIEAMIYELRECADYTGFREPFKRKFAFTHDGVRYRVSCYRVLDGKVICAMRRFPDRLPDINELNHTPRNIKLLQDIGKTRHKGGLIIIGGRTGSGKTTTLIATIRMYLKEFGGFLYTLEDPVEYVIQGRFEENIEKSNVVQREAETEQEWAEGIEDALRSAPQYLLIGEVRTPKAAAEAIRAASTGHLVMVTTHGGSIVQTAANFIQIASKEIGTLAAPQLADCLRLIAHQEIINGKPSLTTLSFDRPDDEKKLRNTVAEGVDSIKKLDAEVERQRNLMKSSVASRPPSQGATHPSRPAGSNTGVSNQPPQRKPSPQQGNPQSPPPKKRGFFGR